MDSLLKADIFFVVTAVAVCAVSVIAIWAMAYLIKILRNVEDISDTVKKEAKKFSQDIDGFRERIGQRRALPRFLMRLMGRLGGRISERTHHKSDKK